VFYDGGFESTPSPPNYNLGGPLPRGSISRAPLLGARVLRGGCFKPHPAPKPEHRSHPARARHNIAAAPGLVLPMNPARRGIILPLPRVHRQVLVSFFFISPAPPVGRPSAQRRVHNTSKPPLRNGYFGSFLKISCFRFRFWINKWASRGPIAIRGRGRFTRICIRCLPAGSVNSN
jgi:hypothetical protein